MRASWTSYRAASLASWWAETPILLLLGVGLRCSAPPCCPNREIDSLSCWHIKSTFSLFLRPGRIWKERAIPSIDQWNDKSMQHLIIVTAFSATASSTSIMPDWIMTDATYIMSDPISHTKRSDPISQNWSIRLRPMNRSIIHGIMTYIIYLIHNWKKWTLKSVYFVRYSQAGPKGVLCFVTGKLFQAPFSLISHILFSFLSHFVKK